METTFKESIRPLLRDHCFECHDEQSREGDLDLTADQDAASVIKNFRRWSVVLDRVSAGEMPPQDAQRQLPTSQRDKIVGWIEQMRQAESERHSGDPGLVLARRLSNAEYNYTIRDLTGADIRPAAEFPIDPANEAGFDNSGESLSMSPALLKKYLEAARTVASHLALTPSGFEFAPHPVMTNTDRDKFCVNRIVDFYRRQNTRYEDCFLVLWRFQNRHAMGRGECTLDSLAAEKGVSVKYCRTLWSLISGPQKSIGPIAALQSLWSELPSGGTEQDVTEAALKCHDIASFVTQLRSSLVPEVPNLTAPEINKGSQALVLWKNRQFVANRRHYREVPVPNGDFGLSSGSDAAASMEPPNEADQAEYRAGLEQFCSIFPDAFYVSERARVYLDPNKEKNLTGRLLSAGFHSQMGYFRDDRPLYDLILNEAEQKELDRLWLELDFVTSAPMRQYAGFIWFDRTDSKFMRDRMFDRYRAEDKDCTSVEKVQGLADAYCEKAKGVGASDEALAAMRFYFRDMSRTFRRLEKLKLASEPRQVDALVEFASRAYRRPLSDSERSSIDSFYQSLRDDDGLEHEAAIRDSVVRILMSPRFCYRVDPFDSIAADQPVKAIQPLDDFALANRLSYFLWSSMPDRRLLDVAAEARLHRPDVLLLQTRRLLNDDRVAGFVNEFAGNWLDFRRFQQHNGVDRGRFPDFTDELRQSMYEEPIRFFSDIVKQDGSVLDFLYADHTFINAALGRHYGVDEERLRQLQRDDWIMLTDASRYGRGGLLPMAVFLTYNSPGLRTSPVKRGNWVIKRMLGEQVPAPPATVPELPSDESKLGALTLRETLALHREHVSCAGCHNRIDSMGLVFESYGPIGEARDTDLGGRPIDATAVFPDDSEGQGLDGLRDYIHRQREDDFVDSLCRKLLAFGLGRTLQLSDESIVETMKQQLAADEYRFTSMIEVIVTSPAFLNKRARTELEEDEALP